MDIYESLNYVSKLAFPKIEYTWDRCSINEGKPIFSISTSTNKIENFVKCHYESGLKSILEVIEKEKLSSELELYAKQLLVVLANKTIDSHSNSCKNNAVFAYDLYRKNIIFRETTIEYSLYLNQLVSNLLAYSFYVLDYKTVINICDNCISKYKDNVKAYFQLISKLRDAFAYNHSVYDLITIENVLNYWEIANYINRSIPDLNFFEIRDGMTIATLKDELDLIQTIIPLEKLFDEGVLWTTLQELPDVLAFEFIYPNGSNGDIIKYVLEEYGETYQISPTIWKGIISKKHIDLLEMLGPTAKKISKDEAFLTIYEHHIPSILSNTRRRLINSKAAVLADFKEIAKKTHEHQLRQRKQRDKIYAELIVANKTSPKWKSEAQLYALVSSIYKDAIYQYRCDWLEMQSLDIYIPSLSIGIEYQGRQHYEPIEHFGGEAHFKHQQENDAKKKALCKNNGITLIEWSYTLDITNENLIKYISDIQNKKE
ncbi:MAG: hypothetical protein E7654_00310 [Ruminococcaceae bacterium]|nr:hypothetical protein [Oscillospiraceae bacterium]